MEVVGESHKEPFHG